MDVTNRGGCATRSVIAVSMLRGPPVVTGVRRRRDGTTRLVPLSRLVLLLALLGGLLVASACGDGAQQAVDRARSQAQDALDGSGLGDDLDRAQARVDDLVAQARDATGVELDDARARAERAVRDARARIERELRQARRDGASSAEVARLRRQARERLDDLRARVDEAFGP